jgi:hypothetical protein
MTSLICINNSKYKKPLMCTNNISNCLRGEKCMGSHSENEIKEIKCLYDMHCNARQCCIFKHSLSIKIVIKLKKLVKILKIKYRHPPAPTFRIYHYFSLL